ncbi:unnamed protein product [Psylliodes chrysocephalus]|uniref:Uncharacterized protein n=1 Tax=Psylliodes chrysocephalus TaxID=3402493 RepID=A0A9P0GCN0_9CUCU|nr:unnamed protein product [Psylliodes chrysocephala]
MSLSESSSTSEIDFQIDGPSTSKARQTDLRGVDFRNLAEACDRTGVSNRCASFLANAVLQDLGVVSRNDPSKLLNRNKLRRERKRRRSEIKKESTRNLEITGLCFDGRKDRTLLMEKKTHLS